MRHHILLIIHLIAATIWIGGHLILAIGFLPKAIKNKDINEIKVFKDKFELVGMPALLVLIVTGILMAYNYDVTFSKWFSFTNGIESIVSIKIILVLITFCLAIFAQFYIFPKLTKKNFYRVILLIISVTLIALAMLVLGSLVRIGGI